MIPPRQKRVPEGLHDETHVRGFALSKREARDMRKMTLAYEQQRRRRQMESPEPDNSKCTGFFCKYGASEDVKANSTNDTRDIQFNLSNESTNAKANDPSSYSNGDSAAEDDGLKGAIIFGLIMSVGILFHSRCYAKASVLTHIAEIESTRGKFRVDGYVCLHMHRDRH